MNRLTILALFGAVALPLTLPAQEERNDERILHQLEAQLRSQESDLAALEEAYAAARVGLRSAEAELELLEAQAPNSAVARIEAHRSDLRIEEAELEVRRAVMEDKMLEFTAEAHEAMASDSLIIRLQGLLQVLDDQFAPEHFTDPNNAEAVEGRLRAIELAVELEARKDLLRERSGGGLVHDLRKRLLEVDIELAVLQARRGALEEERELSMRVEQRRREQMEERLKRSSIEMEKRAALTNESHEYAKLKKELELLRALGYVEEAKPNDDDR